MILSYGHICAEIITETDQPLSVGQAHTITNSDIDAGGSALLQAVAAARAGAKVGIIGTIGRDTFAELILKTLRREGIHTTALVQDDTPSGSIHRTIDSERNETILYNVGANTLSSSEQITDHNLNSRATLLLQDDFDLQEQGGLIKRAQQSGARIILCLQNNTDASSIEADFILDKKEITGDFNAYCGTFAACIQAGMIEDEAKAYAQEAATLSAAKFGAYKALPYLHEIEARLKTNAA